MSEAEYRDILYEERDGVATITFNRPEVLNAFRMGTYEEVTDAIHRAGWNKSVGVIVLTGLGRAFGVGVDRLAMLKYGMSDLRAFFDGDVRWAAHYGFSALDVPTLSGGVGARA